MTYMMKYRKKDQFLWKTLKRVTGDLLAADLPGFKIVVFSDESQMHIPLEGTEFWFSKERFIHIRKQMEKEAGQKLSLARGEDL